MLIQWQETAFGQNIFNWEQQQLDELTTNIFGYYALQLGLTEHDLLQNRTFVQFHSGCIL